MFKTLLEYLVGLRMAKNLIRLHNMHIIASGGLLSDKWDDSMYF